MSELESRLKRFGQEHLLAHASRLEEPARGHFLEQLAALDLDLIADLYRDAGQPADKVAPDELKAPPTVTLDVPGADRDQAVEIGRTAVNAGRVGVVLVAGGQGTRLGFDKPKGMFPLGPVAGTTFFEHFADQLHGWRRRSGRIVPWYIMTSPATDADTRAFFAEHDWFGLGAENVRLFQQGTLPAVDAASGRLLLSGPGELFASPNGHGGVIGALRDSGALGDMKRRGVDTLSYFQVDNIFARMIDLEFLGRHLAAGSEYSLKVVEKAFPTEGLGLVVERGGKPVVIEYSDLPSEVANLRDPDGRLTFRAGSIAIHAFSREFLERLAGAPRSFPYHTARKRIACLDESDRLVQPEAPNGFKFEMFVFDALPMAERWLVAETTRAGEFMPLKNADGADSPASVRRALRERMTRWLAKAGVSFERDEEGLVRHEVEVSFRLALDEDEFASQAAGSPPITGPTRFSP
jgi:UDP-N-acetylglucosamine/UDP-N-acetylgalactosamine diphosphorylase